MTRAVRSRILKDVNGDINDHLRNHIHLTNCIHLKNHMHKQSPILTDRSLMRDLIVLQRSRSLRDPSASPPSWHSPSIADLLSRKAEKDANRIQDGRRSLGADRPPRQGRRLSGTGSSSPFNLLGSSRVAPGEFVGDNELVAGISERSVKGEHRDSRRVLREEHGRDGLREEHGNEYLHDIISRKSDSRETKKKGKGKYIEDSEFNTLSEQLSDVRMGTDDVGMDSDDDVVSSNMRPRDRVTKEGKSQREHEARGALNRGKRRKFRAARRNRAPIASRDARIQSEMSVASNSLGQGHSHLPHPMDEGEVKGVYGEQNVTRAPRNGCGIPWNWSRIHHQGRTFLDMAGRSFSCGLAERKGGPSTRVGDATDMPVQSNPAISSTKSDAEALPLLVGSQESSENAGGLHDYSGELGLYADDLLKNGLYSDLASEGRSGGQSSARVHKHRHQNLTQKYMPQTFKDLVGQNLVTQALSNAVMRRKIGIIYVFYGPHGTGKTSCARIFARALNCQSSESQKPCGYCKSCVAQDMGKSRNVREVGPVSNFDFENIMDLLDSMIVSQPPSQHRVFIFDDCDNLSSDCWSAISKVIDRAPRRVVFLLVCSSLDVLPHIIISRCHKFFFPKLKDADIIYTLQWISARERLEVDKDALKLISSRSDGSLRDALMTLDQLSLLGERICVTLVQELVGLISDEKLVDLLDLALSADTVNTVKSLRLIMETGVEPLGLMSQLATVVTDILAGSYDFTKERSRRKFFLRQPLSKEEMERLRQALKTLSEAEKQLRMSNDKTTWLTAALLQLAPDQQYLIPNSSANNSYNQSPLDVNNGRGREANGGGIEHSELPNNGRGWPLNDRMESIHFGGSFNNPKGHARAGKLIPGVTYMRIEDIWLDVLEKIQVHSIKEFLFQEGKLVSVSFGAAPTVQLTFSSHLTKAKAEKVRGHIMQAFESVLGSTVTIEIRCESGGGGGGTRTAVQAPLPLPAPEDDSSQLRDIIHGARSENREVGSEIVEVEASPSGGVNKGVTDVDRKALEANAYMKLSSSYQQRMKFGEKTPSQSIVRGKVSLAHVIQQAEGCSQHRGWSRKAVSIAEKLEQENLRLESRSRSLLCWKTCGTTRRKLSRLKIRTRRPRSLLRLVSCGKCLSGKSPR